jgi:hypothetical protein
MKTFQAAPLALAIGNHLNTLYVCRAAPHLPS